MAGSTRGFASMDEDRRRELAREGGRVSGGNFKNDRAKASRAGKKGAAAQPTEAKRLGGEHSHQNS